MVAAKEWTNTDPKDAKVLALTTRISKLKRKNSVLETFQGGGCNRTHTRTNTKGRYQNKINVERLNNLESWHVKKSKENITRDGKIVGGALRTR